MHPIPLLLIATFVCLFPLMMYCLYLAGVNNRRRPVFVPGAWDFAWVLLATAGFWLLGGPVILSGLHDQWRRLRLRGDFPTSLEVVYESAGPVLVIWGGYYALVVLGSLALLCRRRRVTVVYNVEAGIAHAALAAALDRRAWPWERLGNAYSIAPGRERDREAFVELAVAPGMRNISLRWEVGDVRVRETLEADLAAALEGHASGENPTVGWLLTAATVLFAVMLFCVVLFVVFVRNLPA